MPKRKRFGVAFALVVIAKGGALKQSPLLNWRPRASNLEPKW
ncbi:hypothetical protein [uncultured Fibrobacter sp.]|nr:hypothetical protein [uncultured Fibrobacter sp.]